MAQLDASAEAHLKSALQARMTSSAGSCVSNGGTFGEHVTTPVVCGIGIWDGQQLDYDFFKLVPCAFTRVPPQLIDLPPGGSFKIYKLDPNPSVPWWEYVETKRFPHGLKAFRHVVGTLECLQDKPIDITRGQFAPWEDIRLFVPVGS